VRNVRPHNVGDALETLRSLWTHCICRFPEARISDENPGFDSPTAVHEQLACSTACTGALAAMAPTAKRAFSQKRALPLLLAHAAGISTTERVLDENK
jgi:hypothetical protein